MGEADRLRRDISKHEAIGIDTCVFIYHFENQRYEHLTTAVLRAVNDGICRGIVSTLNLAEVLVKPLELGRRKLASQYKAAFHEMPNLEMAAVTPEIAELGAAIRGECRVNLPDCIFLSTAKRLGASCFVTNDPEMRRYGLLDIIVLDDYLSG